MYKLVSLLAVILVGLSFTAHAFHIRNLTDTPICVTSTPSVGIKTILPGERSRFRTMAREQDRYIKLRVTYCSHVYALMFRSVTCIVPGYRNVVVTAHCNPRKLALPSKQFIWVCGNKSRLVCRVMR